MKYYYIVGQTVIEDVTNIFNTAIKANTDGFPITEVKNILKNRWGVGFCQVFISFWGEISKEEYESYIKEENEELPKYKK